jgi:hypothetical protein
MMGPKRFGDLTAMGISSYVAFDHIIHGEPYVFFELRRHGIRWNAHIRLTEPATFSEMPLP